MKRYVIKYGKHEFDDFGDNGLPMFIKRGGGRLFRTKNYARMTRAIFPNDIRTECKIKKVKV